MSRRPLPQHFKRMRKEEPDNRRKLIRIYYRGGVNIEFENIEKIGNRNQWGGSIKNKKLVHWLYLGDLWWGRKVGNKFEFGRLMAIENNPKSNIIKYVDLWDERQHGLWPKLIIVHRDNQKGIVVEHNKFEMSVRWDGSSTPERINNLSGIRFEYDEDYKFFKKLLGG